MITVGCRIKDNDPRMGTRYLTLVQVGEEYVRAENSLGRRFDIRKDRIFTDGKARRRGFDLVVT